MPLKKQSAAMTTIAISAILPPPPEDAGCAMATGIGAPGAWAPGGGGMPAGVHAGALGFSSQAAGCGIASSW